MHIYIIHMDTPTYIYIYIYACMQILCIQQLPGNNSWAQLPTQTGK